MMKNFCRFFALLFALTCFLAIAGCGNGSAPVFVDGTASFGEPIQGADVTFYAQDMRPLETHENATNVNGAFRFPLAKSALVGADKQIIIEVAGGTFAGTGKAFEGKLYYATQQSDWVSPGIFHVGPLSTIIAYCELDHPGTSAAQCISNVKTLLDIPDSMSPNDLYYFKTPLPPDVLLAKAAEQGGVDAYLHRIASYVDDPANFDSCMIKQCSSYGESVVGGSSEVSEFIGKALAQGALSYTGGQLAGWVLEGVGGNANGQYNKVMNELAQLESQYARLANDLKNDIQDADFDDRASSLNKGLGYLQDWDSSFHYATTLQGSDYTNYIAKRKNFLLNDFQHDPASDLIDINNSLVGTGFQKSLLELADEHFRNQGDDSEKYYQKMSEFMAYWGTLQNMALNLLAERKHLNNDNQDFKRILDDQDKRFTAQSKLFLDLVEKNLAIDERRFIGDSDRDRNKIEDEFSDPTYQEGYNIFADEDWVKKNWSVYPAMTLHSYTAKYCHTECASGYCWQQCDKVSYYTGEGLKYAKATTSYQQSPELQAADDLVFSLSLFEEAKPITLRFYVDPAAVSGRPTLCGIDSLPDSQLAVTLVNETTHQAYSESPEMNTFAIPKEHYIGQDPPSWTLIGKAQVARYTFRDLPEGTYGLDSGVASRFYHQLPISFPLILGHCGVTPYSSQIGYSAYSDFYGDYTFQYTKNGPAQNMLIMLYSNIQ
ncbi:hypothetical protein [Geopsychrobacter electrodiphilus]|uniref:hypothetical protein n=1 Tax=Geopsychrobacter electrodiphilus TaxID=225196 RepID=UPI0012EB6C3A|nr:hypothetical protein [Geopsychrobacter electrodiphilus]